MIDGSIFFYDASNQSSAFCIAIRQRQCKQSTPASSALTPPVVVCFFPLCSPFAGPSYIRLPYPRQNMPLRACARAITVSATDSRVPAVVTLGAAARAHSRWPWPCPCPWPPPRSTEPAALATDAVAIAPALEMLPPPPRTDVPRPRSLSTASWARLASQSRKGSLPALCRFDGGGAGDGVGKPSTRCGCAAVMAPSPDIIICGLSEIRSNAPSPSHTRLYPLSYSPPEST